MLTRISHSNLFGIFYSVDRMAQLSEFTGWQMSVRPSETWSFPAGASHTAAPAACLSPHGSADAPEQALKRLLWCCHQPLCTDNTLCGCDGCEPSPSPSICSVLSLAGWFLHVTPELSTCICVSVFIPVYICNCSCPWLTTLASRSLTVWLCVRIIPHRPSTPSLSTTVMSPVGFHVWNGHSHFGVTEVVASNTVITCSLSFFLSSATAHHWCHAACNLSLCQCLTCLFCQYYSVYVNVVRSSASFIPKSFKSWWCNCGTSSGKKQSVSSQRSVIIFFHRYNREAATKKKSEKLQFVLLDLYLHQILVYEQSLPVLYRKYW